MRGLAPSRRWFGNLTSDAVLARGDPDLNVALIEQGKAQEAACARNVEDIVGRGHVSEDFG